MSPSTSSAAPPQFSPALPPSAAVLSAAQQAPAPAYLIEEAALEQNCKLLEQVAQRAGAKIVLAQKAFAQPQLYPLIGSYLSGACASGAWEARLAREFFPAEAEILTCAPAYNDADITELLPITNHLDFNSLTQWERYQKRCLSYQKHATQNLHFGLRINPEHSTGDTPLYDPCATGSRLGITAEQLQKAPPTLLIGISGLHFHSLCEQGFSDLEATVATVEARFKAILHHPNISYLNLGGGHWITKEEYDRPALITLCQRLSTTYKLQVYLEPGEAVAIHSGILVATVLDLHQNGSVTNAILDISATAHMPDVLEMPYRPEVFLTTGEQASHEGAYIYRLTGNTCLAGDQIGDYAFSHPLQTGQRLLFHDMAHYTMVKTTLFNGVKHPHICLLRKDGTLEMLKKTDYQHYLKSKI